MSATIAQLLRSGQRDEQYLSQLNNELNQLIQYWFGIRRWIQLRQYLPQMSEFLYYSVTTLSGLQTLGEEYVNIVQTDGNKLLVPKLLRRFVAILMQILSPHLMSTLLQHMSRRIENREKPLPSIVDSHQRREQLLKLIPIIEQSFKLIHRIHLILFYLNGNYYHLSKRVADIRYVSINRSISERSDSQSRTIFKVLGYLSLCQLSISLIVRLYSIQNSIFSPIDPKLNSNLNRVSDQTSEVEVIQRCSLCLEKRKNTSVTPCGHLFCWYCILEWLQMKSECPLCREPLDSSRVVFLQNYSSLKTRNKHICDILDFYS